MNGHDLEHGLAEQELSKTGVAFSIAITVLFLVASAVMMDWRELGENFMFGINNAFFIMPAILLLFAIVAFAMIAIVAVFGYGVGVAVGFVFNREERE